MKPTIIIEGEAQFRPSQCYECSLPGLLTVGGLDVAALIVEKSPVPDPFNAWERPLGNVKITVEYDPTP